MITKTKKTLLCLSLAAMFTGACDVDEEMSNQVGDKSDQVRNAGVDVIDRVGRPEITNFTIRAPQYKAGYNAEDSFNIAPATKPVYLGLIAAGVKFWDGLDNKKDWTETKLDGFVNLLVADFLLIDMDKKKACDMDTDSYLSIERALAKGETPTGCGGRRPNDDVIDDYMTYLVGGFESEVRVRDGADNTTSPITSYFPYLAKPVVDQ